MKDGMIFKKVLFGGYHKGDVLAYIDTLETEKENMKLTLQDEVEKLKEELEQASMQQQYAAYGAGDRSEVVKRLQENLKIAERKQMELKSQLCQAELQNSELIDKLNDMPSEESFNANLRKIQNESRQIVIQQRKEAESILAKVRVSVSALVNRSNDKLSQRESELFRIRGEIEKQTKQIMELEAAIKQKEEEIFKLQKDISDATAYIQALERLNDDQRNQIEDLKAELASMREKASARASEEDKWLRSEKATESYLSNYEETPENDMEGASQDIFEGTESDSEILGNDDLDSIFAEATELLDSSEKKAQGKVIKMSTRVG